MVDQILEVIKTKYIYLLEYPTSPGYFHCNIIPQTSEIVFYHAITVNHYKQFKGHIDDINFQLLKYVQSNYFYRIIRMRHDVQKKQLDNHTLIYKNFIQLTEIEKNPKNAHLAIIKNLKDLYV